MNEKGYAEDRVKIERSQQEGGHSGDLWQIREGGLGATAFPPDGEDHWPGWEDSAVPPSRIAGYIRDLEALYDKYGYRGAMYGHFGQGCIHSRINFDLRTAHGISKFRRFMDEAADLFYKFVPLMRFEFQEGVGLAIRKEIFRRRGVIDGASTRQPGPVLDETTRTALERVLTWTAGQEGAAWILD